MRQPIEDLLHKSLDLRDWQPSILLFLLLEQFLQTLVAEFKFRVLDDSLFVINGVKEV
jgi:hypothetical protein